MEMNNTSKTSFLTTTAIMTAVMCILGPLSIPIGPVPITLTNLAIYLAMYILGTKRGSAAVCLYLLIGLAGLPVFSGFTGGPGKLLGPTGGYLIGFLPMAILIGLFLKHYMDNRILSIIIMEAATWIPYLFGSAWLSYQSGISFAAAMSAGVLPFIIIDLIKIVIAAIIGPQLHRRLAPIIGRR